MDMMKIVKEYVEVTVCDICKQQDDRYCSIKKCDICYRDFCVFCQGRVSCNLATKERGTIRKIKGDKMIAQEMSMLGSKFYW